jgi:hypothetical protein
MGAFVWEACRHLPLLIKPPATTHYPHATKLIVACGLIVERWEEWSIKIIGILSLVNYPYGFQMSTI